MVLALAAAGVGTLTVIDDDEVDLSNLQRQVLHRVEDVGHPKVDSAVRVARDLSPNTTIHPMRERLTEDNATDLLGDADLVLDGADTFETRQIVAAACEARGIPLVWGVVQEFHAQVTVFWSHPPAGLAPVGLDDLYPASSTGEVPTCAQVGVLGALCLQTGSVMATEAIKLITGVGDPLVGRVLVIDALRGRVDEVALRGSRASASTPPADEPPLAGIAVGDVAAALARGATLIDVREPHETAAGVVEGSRTIPLASLLAAPERAGSGPVILICQRGPRAERAAGTLRSRGVEASVMIGGIEAWTGPLVEEVPA
ncbi:adenylyltransferase/sulfurtransferase MoeZ [Microbacterium koreense]